MDSDTCSTSNLGSGATTPWACMTPVAIALDISVTALPMSIWLQAILYFRPSREVDLVSPVTPCLVEV